MTLCYAVDRDEYGTPKLVPVEDDKPPTAEQAFRRRCYLNAVTDPATVDRLWAEEKARLAAREAAAKETRKEKARRGRRVGRNGKGARP